MIATSLSAAKQTLFPAVSRKDGLNRKKSEGIAMKKRTNTELIGRYIVTDPNICHGKPTFRGTRVLVADVLEQVGSGMAWESIVEEWNGSVSKDAIAEAVQLSSKAFLEHAEEYLIERAAA